MENCHEILSCKQVDAVKENIADKIEDEPPLSVDVSPVGLSAPSPNFASPLVKIGGDSPAQQIPEVDPVAKSVIAKNIYHLASPSTVKTFIPRTDDMNKGYMVFSDDARGITSE